MLLGFYTNLCLFNNSLCNIQFDCHNAEKQKYEMDMNICHSKPLDDSQITISKLIRYSHQHYWFREFLYAFCGAVFYTKE